jgi:ATP-dependent Lhr-like helicase
MTLADLLGAAVDSQKDNTIEVTPAKGGAIPGFDGAMGCAVHDCVRQEIRKVLRSTEDVPFLDPYAKEMLREMRENYRALELDDRWLLGVNGDVHIVLWRGGRINNTLLPLLEAQGYRGMNEGISLCLKGAEIHQGQSAIESIAYRDQIDPAPLAARVENKIREKWDRALPDDLLNSSFASKNLDVPGLQETLRTYLTRDSLNRRTTK